MSSCLLRGTIHHKQRVPTTASLLVVLLFLTLLSRPPGASAFVPPPSRNQPAPQKRTTASFVMPAEPSYAVLEPSSQTILEGQWDPVQGVWANAKAVATEEEVPRPLWIFGYGSLVWRPQDSFRNCTAFDGYVCGYRRVWTQRSTDHRGTADAPGLVCTVLSEEELREQGMVRTSLARVYGKGYLIPDHLVAQVLDELDFREKGGYTRAVVDIFKADGSGESVRGLIYAANAMNPNFYLCSSLEEAAHIVAWSHGPSGANIEYLLNVARYLEEVGATCEDTFNLVPLIERVIKEGVDKRALLDKRHSRPSRTIPITDPPQPPSSTTSEVEFSLHGCGSNQYGQLGGCPSAEGESGAAIGPEVHQFTPVQLAVTVESDQARGEAAGTTTGPMEPLGVLAGGGHSAVVLSSGDYLLWGWNDFGQLGFGATATKEGKWWSPQMVKGLKVSSLALGHSHTLAIEKASSRLYGWGSNSFGEATGGEACPMVQQPTPVQGPLLPHERVVSCDAGVRHSAAVTEQGEVVTWGSSRHGECLGPASTGTADSPRWRPPGASAIEVRCGMRHTVVLDSLHRVWTWGEGKHGQLGREGDQGPHEVRLLEQEEEWEAVEVVSGWSHVVVLARRSTSGDGEGRYQNEDLLSFRAWLEAIDCGQFFDRFIQAGYDLAFTAEHGLSDDDLDCVGVPMSLLGLRKKLKALHRLDEFKDKGGTEGEEEEEEEDDEDEEDEEETEEEGDDEEEEDDEESG